MATIHNQQLTKNIRDEAKIQTSVDNVPTEISKIVVPVIQTNQKTIQLINATAYDSASETIFTAHAKKRTFIIGYFLSTIKDANSNANYSQIKCTPIGQAEEPLIRMRFKPLAIGDFTKIVSFKYPLEIEKGSTVSVGHDSALASIDSTGGIQYYEDE